MVEQYNKLEKFETSLKYLKEIEELFPYDVNLYIAYMEVYILLDDIEKAKQSIEKGLNILENHPALLYRLAFMHFALENEEMGMMVLEDALNQDSDGVQEFIDFDPTYIMNNERIMNLINEYKNN